MGLPEKLRAVGCSSGEESCVDRENYLHLSEPGGTKGVQALFTGKGGEVCTQHSPGQSWKPMGSSGTR